MIRKFETKDLLEVMELWLSTNIQAHDFIFRDYWVGNFDIVKGILLDEVISELTGQFSDGWGEGFEQRPIDTPDGELYLSFWDAGNGFFMKKI